MHYKPNRKGGHRHNHIYNVCHKHALRSKQARKNISRETKKELIRGFYKRLRERCHPLGWRMRAAEVILDS